MIYLFFSGQNHSQIQLPRYCNAFPCLEPVRGWRSETVRECPCSSGCSFWASVYRWSFGLSPDWLRFCLLRYFMFPNLRAVDEPRMGLIHWKDVRFYNNFQIEPYLYWLQVIPVFVLSISLQTKICFFIFSNTFWNITNANISCYGDPD